MKNAILTLLLLVIASVSYSKELPPVYMLDKSEKDESLGKNEAVFKFTFNQIYDENTTRKILYSIDGKDANIPMINNSYIEVHTSPGKHVFQFFYSERYYEITTDSLAIAPQHRDDYSIYFEDALYPVEVEKPVIYLYPEIEMDVEVHVQPTGKMVFTYPPLIDSWKVHAKPNGELIVDDKSYNYLFWESEQENFAIDWKEGFSIPSSDVVSFLETQLTAFGLTTKEQADFITFWAPQMVQHPGCYVHFVLNEDCDQFAQLNISPTPDLIARLYMIWHPIDNIHDFDYLRPQNIQSINRLGFTVLEWGGAEVKHLPMKNEAL